MFMIPSSSISMNFASESNWKASEIFFLMSATCRLLDHLNFLVIAPCLIVMQDGLPGTLYESK
jgi:hypothetical protein